MDITYSLADHYLEYNNGNLFWKKPRQNIKVGQKAGCIDSHGYVSVTLNGKFLKVHRIIFYMHYGYLPDSIDHIDGNKLNNSIENLRPATSNQNQWNRKKLTRGLSGFKNVSWNKKMNKWRVSLSINRVAKHIGYFDDIELADLVAQEARNKYHGQFANHK